ncbi:MAG: winged helix-turn-helix domain-containing protein [Chloroflexi bacterium]|nr:winged helix-turn-helix domain-containing protein [Chloroflexota bacterium]
MTAFADYPAGYRAEVLAPLIRAVSAGNSVALLGLSGSGKSNLLGFLAHRPEAVAGLSPRPPRFALLDCNRLPDRTPQAFFRLALRSLGAPSSIPASPASDPLEALDATLSTLPAACLLLDRFDDLALTADPAFFNNLRALRDAHKYRLTYLLAARRPLTELRPLPEVSEFAELFSAHTLYLGPLSPADARWNVGRYAARHATSFTQAETRALIELSGGYAGLLRGALEAWHTLRESKTPQAPPGPRDLPLDLLLAHPALRARLEELWNDLPGDRDLTGPGARALLTPTGEPIPLWAAFLRARTPAPAPGLRFDPRTDALTRDGRPLEAALTPKEHALLTYFFSRPGEVCEKDDLIRGVWPEDAIFERGVRDDSLAQLVRRLREKVERDPSNPQHILTVPGRGYRLAA